MQYDIAVSCTQLCIYPLKMHGLCIKLTHEGCLSARMTMLDNQAQWPASITVKHGKEIKHRVLLLTVHP